jgi:hypothetical protein
MSARERERIRERHGVDLPEITRYGDRPGDDWLSDRPFTNCPALTEDKKCSVYEDRPLICRIWGVAETLPCVYGCVPDEPLDAVETMCVMADVEVAGGPSVFQREKLRQAGVDRPMTSAQIRAAARRNPERVERLREAAKGWSAHDANRARAYHPGEIAAEHVPDHSFYLGRPLPSPMPGQPMPTLRLPAEGGRADA